MSEAIPSCMIFRIYMQRSLNEQNRNTMSYGRGPPMAKNEVKLTYTFVNPNTPKAFENTFKKILIDKLLSQKPQTAD